MQVTFVDLDHGPCKIDKSVNKFVKVTGMKHMQK